MRGFHWKAVDEVLTVERVPTVILKAQKRKNLYILEGSTILGDANATTSLEYETRLWHARLGHMSEKVPEKLDWDAAMRKEMKSLHNNQTWELVELPNGKRAIDCKWAYVVKDVSTDAVEKIFKARLVTKGFEQRKGIDYTEVFSLVAKFSTIWLLCALVTLFGLFLDHMYVDDMLIAAKDRYEIIKLKVQLTFEFNMKDLDPAKRILSMEIHRDESSNKLWLT
ncbi:hypothetical protein AXG93_406s1750 [Marchantia polymorpha subsp. ruderalis]|uniref:Reverse transcriptase Ty1/copia-type domain-containing protein n=1 Tax=Marchantia polymorpha subsp. ruderalis TaxID=1480154 RepID=A0A176VCB5_MARPO|nr:hypothetical protein AXG93_406s1750 [Marchantia polymorpha subsp. ruderalis]